MDEPDETMSSDDRKSLDSTSTVKAKPKKRSLVERELETSLTARVTSPVTSNDGSSTSRYGRARRLKTDADYCDTEKAVSNALKSSRLDTKPPIKSPAYKMHAVNSPVRSESPNTIIPLAIENKLENQIENIYNTNISLSRFGSEEKKNILVSPAKKFPKVYTRKDMIQTKDKPEDKEETVTLIKNIFSPVKQYKPSTTNNHLNNIFERSEEKYNINSIPSKPLNGLKDSSSVVKTLDFDCNKKKKRGNRDSNSLISKSEAIELEAKSEYQIGDLAWARMGTYPFWPCIITREPTSELFVRKKLFGRIERNILHVTFFGDNGRRSWIMDTMLRQFLGRREFEATRDQFTPEAKRKDPRLYGAFFISEKKLTLWGTSVEEAETLLQVPKCLRIDLLYDMLCKTMTVKPTLKSHKIEKIDITNEVPKTAKMDNDVSLSESLFDTLFSEDDGKADDTDRIRNKRHKSLDVSEVVTACLDNMAAKSGITTIQKQSHMDRWLQKAKSKTPEKSQIKITVTVEKIDEKIENTKVKAKDIKIKNSKKKKKTVTTVVPLQKPYSLRKTNESRNLHSHDNEHDYSCKIVDRMDNRSVKLDKLNTKDATSKENQVVDILQDNNVIAKDETKCDMSEDKIEWKGLETTLGNKNIILNKNETEENVDNGHESETSKPETMINDVSFLEMEAEPNTKNLITPSGKEFVINVSSCEMEKDQDLKDGENIIPLETETINNPTCFKMEVDHNLKDEENIQPEKEHVLNVFCSEMKVDKSLKDTSQEEVKNDLSCMEADQGLKEIPPEVESTKNDSQSSFFQVEESRRDKKVISVDECKTCNHFVSSDNINLTENDCSVILKPEVINTDQDIKNTNEQQNTQVAELFLDHGTLKYFKRIKNVLPDAVDSKVETVLAEKQEPTNGNLNIINIESIATKFNYNNDDTEMSTDDDITNCGSDFSSTDIVVDAIDKLLTEKFTMVTTNKKVTIQNDAKNEKEIRNLEDKVYNGSEGNIQCKNIVEPVQENNEENQYKLHESMKTQLQDEVLNYEIEKSTAEDKSMQTDINTNNNQDKVITSVEMSINVEQNLHLNSTVNEIDFAQLQNNKKEHQKESTLERKNVPVIESNSNQENGSVKNVSVKVIKEELDLDNVSMNSVDSDISILPRDVIPLSNGLIEPVLNGFHVKDYMQKIKNELLQDSDTASVCSELDVVTSNELKLPKSVTTEKERNKMCEKISDNQVIDVDKIESTVNQVESKENNFSKIEKKNSDTNIKICNTDNGAIFLDREVSIKIRRLSLQKVNSSSVVIKENGFHDSKFNSPDLNIKEELDPDTVSIKSEGSTDSSTKLKSRRNSAKTKDKLKDPKFMKYLVATQDALMDDHPELTYDEIVAYLYKSWSYKESCVNKAIETEESQQIQNLLEDTTPPKKSKKNTNREKKVIDIQKVLSKEPKKLSYFFDNILKDKPKRKVVRPYYNEDYSDIEDEIQMFEIFKKKPKKEFTEVPIESNDFKSAEDAKLPVMIDIKTESSQTENDNQVDTIKEEYYDEVEAYFEELTYPKPNIFKGLVREKVCELCEETTNLIKCKGCNEMFHVECVKKEMEVVEEPAPVKVRGRKKKKGSKGRKPKTSTDSNGLDSESQSDEKSQDLNASDEQNMSVEEVKEPESYLVADADSFEAQLAAKMKEMIETADDIEYNSYSSDDGLDWSDTVAGKCEIVDVKPKPKRISNTDFSDFKCNNCQKYDTPLCFVCKLTVSPKDQSEHRQRCQVAHCPKYYHLKCLDQWPQTQFNSGEPSRNNKKINEHFETLTCPRHVCHTCVCDDPRGCKTRFSGDKLARCIRCPATYHSFTKCLPAGTKILTASHIICPRHYQHRPGKVPCHVNTGWCFICALGGSLICCEYCPTSFHAECLSFEPPAGGYMCEDCETGRLPLYGEMVWVKLGHYRWWPGLVLHPCEIPDNIMAVKHTLGEFVVRFFGQYDHYWVNRGRVFPFQEGDSGRVSKQKSKLDEAFTLAIQHAQRAFEILKNTKSNEEESMDIASSLLPPHYVKLKVNKPCGSLCGRRVDVEESSLTQCDCNPDEEDPCGPYSHCLNRMLLTECGPSCRAGERCNNRAFEKRLYPKLTPYRTPHRGWGLKTLEDIKPGQFVIEYVGELIDEEEFRRRMNRKHEIRDENFYFLTLDKERMIDAGPKGNLARFMNHCCEPNCETQKWTVLGDVRVGLFALKLIPANSEVTFNYNLECAGIDKKQCMCGAKRCSGYIGAKPKQDEPQSKKTKVTAKRPYKKRKNPDDSPSTSKSKCKRPAGRPCVEKPRELTEIEKDLLIIQNAINGITSDSEGSGRLSSMDIERDKKDRKALKRKRDDCSTEDVSLTDSSLNSPSSKKVKKTIDVGD